jgi:pyroglutamyl-peptidase
LFNITIINSQSNNINKDTTIILVVGFGPFLNYSINPSELIAAELNGEILNNAEIIGLQVQPNLSNFTESIEIVYKAIEDYNPDYIFSIGLAAKFEKIRIEKIGYNLKIEIKDDPSPEKLVPNGPWIYISPLPAYKIVNELKSEKIPSQIGMFPGLSLCNGMLYSILYYIDVNDLNIKSGFIHVPLIKNEENPNGMELQTMVNATRIIIQVTLDFN